MDALYVAPMRKRCLRRPETIRRHCYTRHSCFGWKIVYLIPNLWKQRPNLIHNHKIFIWILLGVISMHWSNDFMGGHIFMYQRTLLSQCSVSSYNINFVNRKNQMTWINEYQFVVFCRALWHLYSVLIGNIVNEYVHVLNLFFNYLPGDTTVGDCL